MLYARYYPQHGANGLVARIAAEVGVHPSQISRDLKALDLTWIETQADTIARLKAKLIAEIERDIEETRADLLRSRTTQPTEDTIEGTPDGKGGVIPERAVRRKRSAAADTRYQVAITAMRDQLAKIVGLYAPTKVGSDPDQPLQLAVEQTGDQPLDHLRDVVTVLMDAGVLPTGTTGSAPPGDDDSPHEIPPA